MNIKTAQEIILKKYNLAVYRNQTARNFDQRVQAETERMVLCEVLVDAFNTPAADIARARATAEIRAVAYNQTYKPRKREPAPDLSTIESQY